MYLHTISDHWPELLTVYIATFVAFTSPGPNFIAITSYSVQDRDAGVGVATGISFGTALWALLASTGITAFLTAFENASLTVSIIGGLYLCWLGYKSIRSALQNSKFNASLEQVNTDISFLEAFRTGLLIQLTNPKTALFWLALTSAAIRPNTEPVVVATLVLGCLFIALLWHIALAYVFSTGPIRQAYINFKTVISSVFGVLFAGFGLRVLYNAYREMK